jgi:hypothetical protein
LFGYLVEVDVISLPRDEGLGGSIQHDTAIAGGNCAFLSIAFLVIRIHNAHTTTNVTLLRAGGLALAHLDVLLLAGRLDLAHIKAARRLAAAVVVLAVGTFGSANTADNLTLTAGSPGGY